MEKINALLAKYENFKYAQMRWIEEVSDSSKVVTIVIQDDDGEDVSSVKVTFTGIKDERILVNSVLGYLDMGFGVSMINERDLFGFALGSGTAMLHVRNAPLYIVATGMTIEEVPTI